MASPGRTAPKSTMLFVVDPGRDGHRSGNLPCRRASSDRRERELGHVQPFHRHSAAPPGPRRRPGRRATCNNTNVRRATLAQLRRARRAARHVRFRSWPSTQRSSVASRTRSPSRTARSTTVRPIYTSLAERKGRCMAKRIVAENRFNRYKRDTVIINCCKPFARVSVARAKSFIRHLLESPSCALIPP